MKIQHTNLPGVIIIVPKVYRDERGFFLESYRADLYEMHGVPARFVQDNHSKSASKTLRGLHYQNPHAQGKLVRVIQGSVFDVAVDIRVGSPTFGKWYGTILSSENMQQMYTPQGFAHGFCVLSDEAQFEYKCTDTYAPDCEGGIRWDDPDIAIDWPIDTPLLSEKDKKYTYLRDIPAHMLPKYALEVGNG